MLWACVLGGCDVATAADPQVPVRAPADPRVLADVPTGETELEGARFVEVGLHGDAHHPPRRVVAYVPRADRGARLPVLYVFDGQAAFTVWDLARVVDELVARGDIEPWIVIAIDSGAARTEELARHSERHADFVADVIAPAVDAALPTRTDPASTAVLGFSYGGLAAVRGQLHRPDRFGRVIAMSPSLWFAGRAALTAFRRARGPAPTRLWVDIGSREGRPGEIVPYMVGDARALRDAALARGMRFGADLGAYEAIGDDHDMDAAGRRMRTALAFALSEIDLSTARPSELHVARYPVPARARRGTFAIEARYDHDLRLTWPAPGVELRSGEDRVVGELVRRGAPLRAIVGGIPGDG